MSSNFSETVQRRHTPTYTGKIIGNHVSLFTLTLTDFEDYFKHYSAEVKQSIQCASVYPDVTYDL